jgi:hypothetical protein
VTVTVDASASTPVTVALPSPLARTVSATSAGRSGAPAPAEERRRSVRLGAAVTPGEPAGVKAIVAVATSPPLPSVAGALTTAKSTYPQRECAPCTP